MRYSFLVKEWGIHSSLRNEVFLKSVEKKKKTLTWESHQNGSAKQNTQRISQLYKAQGWQAPPDHLVNIWSTAVREHLQWENICGGDDTQGTWSPTPRQSGWQAWPPQPLQPLMLHTARRALTSHPSQFEERSSIPKKPCPKWHCLLGIHQCSET